MGKHTFFALMALTVVWIILVEELTWQSVAMGMLISMVCMYFGKKFLPFSEIKSINFYKLATYPFFLVGQIYMAGFQVIRIILKGSVVDVVTVKSKLKDETLRIILADSVTLTPGSILLELTDDFITLLWIRDKGTPGDPETAVKLLTNKLERRLLKAEKSNLQSAEE